MDSPAWQIRCTSRPRGTFLRRPPASFPRRLCRSKPTSPSAAPNRSPTSIPPHPHRKVLTPETDPRLRPAKPDHNDSANAGFSPKFDRVQLPRLNQRWSLTVNVCHRLSIQNIRTFGETARVSHNCRLAKCSRVPRRSTRVDRYVRFESQCSSAPLFAITCFVRNATV